MILEFTRLGYPPLKALKGYLQVVYYFSASINRIKRLQILSIKAIKDVGSFEDVFYLFK